MGGSDAEMGSYAALLTRHLESGSATPFGILLSDHRPSTDGVAQPWC